MKRIRYDGEELIMLNEVADALVAYTLSLARSEGFDVVSVPTLSTSGATTTVDLFLHPNIHLSSRLIDEPQDSRHPAAAFVADLELRTAGVDTGSWSDEALRT